MSELLSNLKSPQHIRLVLNSKAQAWDVPRAMTTLELAMFGYLLEFNSPVKRCSSCPAKGGSRAPCSDLVDVGKKKCLSNFATFPSAHRRQHIIRLPSAFRGLKSRCYYTAIPSCVTTESTLSARESREGKMIQTILMSRRSHQRVARRRRILTRRVPRDWSPNPNYILTPVPFFLLCALASRRIHAESSSVAFTRGTRWMS